MKKNIKTYIVNSLIISILMIVFSVASYGGENHAPEETKTSNNAPQKSTQAVKKTPTQPPTTVNVFPPVASTPLNNNRAENQSKEKQQSSDRSWLYKLKTDPIAGFTLLLFIATFLLWWTTRKLVVGAEKTAEQQLRAYVLPKLPEIPVEISDYGVLTVTTTINNFGKTPAHSMEVCQNIGIYSLPITSENPIDIPVYDTDGSKSVVAPGEDVFIKMSLPNVHQGRKVSNIESGKWALFINGKIKYIDVFGRLQQSNYCLISTGETFKRKTLSYYNEGNTAT